MLPPLQPPPPPPSLSTPPPFQPPTITYTVGTYSLGNAFLGVRPQHTGLSDGTISYDHELDRPGVGAVQPLSVTYRKGQ